MAKECISGKVSHGQSLIEHTHLKKKQKKTGEPGSAGRESATKIRRQNKRFSRTKAQWPCRMM